MSMPGEDFLSASTWQPASAGVTEGAVPASWAQGRASFGGLVTAIAVRPMLKLVPADRWLRTVSVTFVAPLAAAPAQCHTQVLREGRALTSIESRIIQEGSVRCIAIATFAADRAVNAIVAPPAVPVREPGQVIAYAEGMMPKFLQHYVMRWDSSSRTEGSGDAHILGACRSHTDERDADVCDVLALLDVWPPALVTIMKSFSAGSTASWTVDFVSSAVQGLTSSWWSYEVRAVAASGGYGQTQAWLWDPEGRAVARSTQLVAVFE
jgi:acyl-CoA thioesterase